MIHKYVDCDMCGKKIYDEPEYIYREGWISVEFSFADDVKYFCSTECMKKFVSNIGNIRDFS